jgi:hypothetical protein
MVKPSGMMGKLEEAIVGKYLYSFLKYIKIVYFFSYHL